MRATLVVQKGICSIRAFTQRRTSMIAFEGKMATFHFIRHGQSEANATDVSAGGASPLSDRGRAQAEALGRWLRLHDVKMDGMFSSTMVRAHDTADLVAQGLSFPQEAIIRDDRLSELDRGPVWRDKSRRDLLTPEVERALRLEGMDFRSPGGESLHDTAGRMMRWLIDTFDTHVEPDAHKTFLVVTHGNALRALLQRLLTIDPRVLFLIQIWNTSITSLTHMDRGWALERLNATPHLDSGLTSMNRADKG